MSRFLYHESCNRCGSKDNLAVFDDGHKWCFGCHYYEPSTTNLCHVFSPQTVAEQHTKAYPYDANNYIPSHALRWLLSCGVSYERQLKYGIQWSPSRQMVVWKILSPNGLVLGWQGRCFAPDAKVKYISHGKIHEDVCVLGEGGDKVVLVEDFLSAINVSDVLPCSPLFGCTCSLNALGELRKRFNRLVVHLDSDKLDNARKVTQNASMLGFTTEVVYTEKDPKYYTLEELRRLYV